MLADLQVDKFDIFKDTFFMQTLLHLCWHEVHLFEYVTLILYINVPESKPVNSFINVR